MRIFITALLFVVSCLSARAVESVSPWDFRHLLVSDLQHRYYVGVGGGLVHHTGYVPGSMINIEKWVGGGKTFAGMLLTDQIRLEGTYYYLGKASLLDATPPRASEQSQALGFSALVYTPELARWGVPSFLPTRLFARAGGQHRWIDQRVLGGKLSESGASYHVGGGIELDLTSRVFIRFEYEYLGKNISGTNRVVDVQHTPLSFALGGRF